MSDNKDREELNGQDASAFDANAASAALEPDIVLPGDDDAAADEAELTLAEQLTAAETQAAEYLDGWQRARAEFANARKRLERERIEAYGNATVDVMQRLLPALDDFERAIENVPDDVAADEWFKGIGLVQRKLVNALEAFNIRPIEAVGQPFDPNVHEAVMQEPSDEFESQSVVRVLQTGYRMDQRVVRPALVVVAV